MAADRDRPGDAGTYLTDAALLETLVRGKLDGQAEDVRAEGWAWVEAVPHMSHADRQTFQSAPRRRREPTARESGRIASLQTRLDKLDAELEEAYDTEDEGRAEALEPRREQHRRWCERRGRPRRRRSTHDREPVRPAGAAVERPPYGGAANRSRPASAHCIGGAVAWHGANRVARPLPRP